VSWPHDPLRRIVAAVDGSPTSIQAAEAAIALAAQTGAQVLFLHVLDEQTLRQLASLFPEPPEQLRLRLESSMARTLAHLAELAHSKTHLTELAGSQGVPCTTRVEEGDPPRVIDRVADEVGADLILVGKTGHRGVKKLLVGSVTRRLMECTSIPVLVIAGSGDEPAALA
jgi:nucleotide-binding universal stress UspA family protein